MKPRMHAVEAALVWAANHGYAFAENALDEYCISCDNKIVTQLNTAAGGVTYYSLIRLGENHGYQNSAAEAAHAEERTEGRERSDQETGGSGCCTDATEHRAEEEADSEAERS